MSRLQQPVLVVDDEADIRDLMEMTLMKMGLQVDTAVGVEEAKSKLAGNRYSLVLTDMRMPDGSGLEVVQYLNELMLDTPIAVITAFGNADQAVEALKAGAFDYLQKPITLSQLRSLVKSAISVNENNETAPPRAPAEPSAPQPAAETPPQNTMPLFADGMVQEKNDVPSEPESIAGKPQVGGEADMPRLLGGSPQMVEARHLIRRLAGSNVPVYIAGESGTGKEQAARTIHELSERAGKPFVAVNCGAIPENLMESEFFGYKKGSFTGADQDRSGFFQYADGGTLFLDEVADLPLAMQVKLLRAIQEKAVRRIGDAQETAVDVRIICATHKNLEALVESGAFRQDLYYRLNVVSVQMPPLREMREDMDALITYLLHKHCKNRRYTLSPKAQDALRHYSYPGNFRELENILERAVALAVGDVIQLDDLQIQMPSAHSADRQSESETAERPSLVCTAESVASAGCLQAFDPRTMQIQDYLDEVERDIIRQILQQTRYNRTQAAKLLGISFRSMRYRMERLGIE
ncbi:sigma-54-dependent transcriptional regulator [Neisseria animalis]|uniref:Response regulator n=1 Tax=Neisseria animalis TaxID=492 RepID=A0A5P3MRL3_NEIAN|nr:sigma-54 dependent transcriptional regulator [Neisseria animalis]QEY23725.1 response regulator [Neisseria animalis]ROW32867.1 response regulator [Neisseria animalis]VEE09566.1 transcriptional regulator [Neisseria animalis]